MQVFLHKLPARLQVGKVGDAIADGLKVVDRQRNIDTACHRDQMQHRVRAAPQSHHGDHGVFKRRAGHDVTGLDVVFQQFQDRFAGTSAFVFLHRVFRRRACRIGKRHAERFDGGRHGVGGVHPPARPGAGATLLDDLLSFFVTDLTGNELTVALKSTHDVKFFSVSKTRPNRPSVNHDRGPIQTPHGHQAAGHIFVTTRQRYQGVVPLRSHDGFDRIRDQGRGFCSE